MRFFFSILIAACSFADARAEIEKIYWESEYYSQKEVSKTQYVYHRCREDFRGDWIIPLNMMMHLEGYSEVYQKALLNYKGREELMRRVIPTLNCLWNDVIFLSPLHPHKQYEAYVELGYTPYKGARYFKIPVEVLKDKRVTVWKWMSYKVYPKGDPIHASIESYCSFDPLLYKELEELPEDTLEFFTENFDPENPGKYPPFNWYRIPHILCQDPIDLSDERITVIVWDDPVE